MIAAYLSLIGWNEAAAILAVLLVLRAADRFLLWHDTQPPWRGLLRK